MASLTRRGEEGRAQNKWFHAGNFAVTTKTIAQGCRLRRASFASRSKLSPTRHTQISVGQNRRFPLRRAPRVVLPLWNKALMAEYLDIEKAVRGLQRVQLY